MCKPWKHGEKSKDYPPLLRERANLAEVQSDLDACYDEDWDRAWEVDDYEEDWLDWLTCRGALG